MPKGWQWDETLFRGSAPFYEKGRLPYAPGLADALSQALGLDGEGRLLDVGCGPGILTLTLAPRFAAAVGVDPDPGMLAEAARRAEAAGMTGIAWVQARAEELLDVPGGLGTFPVATFGQSFHWMDRLRVATIMRELLEPGGAFVHIADVKTPRALEPDAESDPDPVPPFPPPPYAAVEELVRGYLGPERRAGQGVLAHGTPGNEAAVLRDAGYDPPERIAVPAGPPLLRTADDIVAWAYSRSGSAPHLFGDRRAAFEADLRHLLRDAAPDGRFSERPPDTEIVIWRCPGGSLGVAPPATQG